MNHRFNIDGTEKDYAEFLEILTNSIQSDDDFILIKEGDEFLLLLED